MHAWSGSGHLFYLHYQIQAHDHSHRDHAHHVLAHPLVLVGGDAKDGLQRRDDLGLLDLLNALRHLAEFKPARSLDNRAVAGFKRQIERVEIIHAAACFEFG